MVASASILAVPILATKLYVPRHRLIERLNVGLSADNKPEGMPKESRFDKEIASRRALATPAPGAHLPRALVPG